MPTTLTKRLAVALANPRETAGEHIRKAVQVLLNLLEFGMLEDEDRKDVRVALHRLWLALREIERGNVWAGDRGMAGLRPLVVPSRPAFRHRSCGR